MKNGLLTKKFSLLRWEFRRKEFLVAAGKISFVPSMLPTLTLLSQKAATFFSQPLYWHYSKSAGWLFFLRPLIATSIISPKSPLKKINKQYDWFNKILSLMESMRITGFLTMGCCQKFLVLVGNYSILCYIVRSYWVDTLTDCTNSL